MADTSLKGKSQGEFSSFFAATAAPVFTTCRANAGLHPSQAGCCTKPAGNRSRAANRLSRRDAIPSTAPIYPLRGVELGDPMLYVAVGRLPTTTNSLQPRPYLPFYSNGSSGRARCPAEQCRGHQRSGDAAFVLATHVFALLRNAGGATNRQALSV